MNLFLFQTADVIKQTVDSSSASNNSSGISFFKKLTSITWDDVLEYIPVLITGIIVLVIFYLLANFFAKKLTKFLQTKTKTKNVLAAEFFGNVLWLIIFGIGLTFSLYIWGLGEFSTTILSAGALGTFVVSFALKDIFENFLAGVIIAFDPPFELGSLIEVTGLKGRVIQMSLRETIMKTPSGVDIFIPNSTLLKNPLQNFTLDKQLRKEFSVSINYNEHIDEALNLIVQTLKSIDDTLGESGKEPRALISSVQNGSVTVNCMFWYNMNNSKLSEGDLYNTAIIKVLNALDKSGQYLPGENILQVQLNENQNLKDNEQSPKNTSSENSPEA